MSEHKIIIAIDGYSSCGKSTIAKDLAGRLGYSYIDSGAMYRAVTLYFVRNNVDVNNATQVAEAIKDIHLSFVFNVQRKAADIYLNGENVEPYIREMAVAERVSEVAALRDVRTFAVAQQKRMGTEKGIVMDGRDIGTTVFPDAELKIFMTADPDVRAIRRYKELAVKNPDITIEEVKQNLEQRDHIDATRKESPLRQATDAILLDNSNLTPEQQLSMAEEWVRQRTGAIADK